MPRPPAPLPASLALPFRVGAAGVTRRRTRAGDLVIPTRGARLGVGAAQFADHCRAFALMLPPTAAFSHVTAARLLALPLPPWADETLHAIVPPGSQPRRDGLVAHRHTLAARDVVIVDGIRVTSPARTCCDLAASLGVVGTTVIADHIAHRMPVEVLTEMLSRYRARRGRVTLRVALDLVDGRSESPKETELRLLLLDAGFGPFDVNHEIFDETGVLVARVDLALTARRVAVEYEGDHHRDRDQWRRDIARRRRIEAVGWRYIPVTQADLAAPRAVLRDLRAAVSTR